MMFVQQNFLKLWLPLGEARMQEAAALRITANVKLKYYSDKREWSSANGATKYFVEVLIIIVWTGNKRGPNNVKKD